MRSGEQTIADIVGGRALCIGSLALVSAFDVLERPNRWERSRPLRRAAYAALADIRERRLGVSLRGKRPALLAVKMLE
jgi:hypothetical protein